MIAKNTDSYVFPKHFYIDNVEIKEVGASASCDVAYTLEYAADYYPYGKILREYNPQAEKYLTTHHERDTETGLDYRGARYYDSDVARFLSLDPEAMKYPTLSAYNYVAGNPVTYVDPDGRKIVTFIKIRNEETGKNEKFKVSFDGKNASIQKIENGEPTGTLNAYKSGTNEFVDNIVESYNYIVENNADIDNAMQEMAKSNIEVTVEFQKNGGEYFNSKIKIDFGSGLKIYDKAFGKNHLGNQSPALGFWSEIFHAYIDLIDANLKARVGGDVDKEEDIVHVEKEGKVIDALKKSDSKNDETKRKKYEDADAIFKAKSATSTEEIKK